MYAVERMVRFVTSADVDGDVLVPDDVLPVLVGVCEPSRSDLVSGRDGRQLPVLDDDPDDALRPSSRLRSVEERSSVAADSDSSRSREQLPQLEPLPLLLLLLLLIADGDVLAADDSGPSSRIL